MSTNPIVQQFLDSNSDLPVIPVVAIKLLQLTAEHTTASDDIATVLKSDSSLSAKVLRVVNSAFFGLPKRINNLSHAVTLLGVKQVRNIALELSLFDYIYHGHMGKGFNPITYWQHSLFVAILSRRIGRLMKLADVETLYLAGLMHDLGKVIMEFHSNVSYSDLLGSFHTSGVSLYEYERVMAGISHDEIAYEIFTAWEFPDAICQAAASHHHLYEKDLSPETLLIVSIVAVADFVAWTQGLGSHTLPYQPQPLPEFIQQIPIDKLDLIDLLHGTDLEMKQLGGVFRLQFPSIEQLRANVVKSLFQLQRHIIPPPHNGSIADEEKGNLFHQENQQSLTSPHRSLDPDHFIPMTLKALYHDFGCDRFYLIRLNRHNRSTFIREWWPQCDPCLSHNGQPRQLPLTNDIKSILRGREPSILTANDDFVSALKAAEMGVVPILVRNRVVGLIGFDNRDSGKSLQQPLLKMIVPVAFELGI
ncbi:MAG: HDOD domain-containing protein, partial [Gammaproteobacteria bacterium]|nr:HDOD domain-containing protein [Gammaproteobacteria bacterium]